MTTFSAKALCHCIQLCVAKVKAKVKAKTNAKTKANAIIKG